ncbi:Cell cycle checkpoint protein rad17 [Kappamyces sp. JEL0829]|nr:Cell cycle checkpoint protein rad17 [Kappamyces sp. JEL0829]
MSPRTAVSDAMLIDRYPPLHPGELALHKRKLHQVRQWFSSITSTPAILLLSGPTGSAKTATIKCLCSEFHLDIVEWENPINPNILTSEKEYVSVTDLFVSTIQDCSHTVPVEFAGNPGRTTRKSILLVDDLPNVSSVVSRNAVHAALETYISSASATRPVVFIISDVSSNDKSYHLNKWKLLSPLILASKRFKEIQFNPIAKTIMVPALSRIVEKEARLKAAFAGSKSKITSIAETCAGNIRKAINFLEFYGESASDATVAADAGGEEFSLFRVLGKILYNKRDDTVSPCEFVLTDLSKHRTTLSFDPESKFAELNIDTNTFQQFLFQNYAGHTSSVGEAVAASEYLSASDLFPGSIEYQTLSPYAISTAMRGVLFAWDSPAAAGRSKSPAAVTKPEEWEVMKKARENTFQWSEHYQHLASENELDQEKIIMPNMAFTELLPFFGLISQRTGRIIHGVPPGFRQFIASLCDYAASRSAASIKGKADSEYEPLDDDADGLADARSSSSKAQLGNRSDSIHFLNKLKQMKASKSLVLSDDDIET